MRGTARGDHVSILLWVWTEHQERTAPEDTARSDLTVLPAEMEGANPGMCQL